MVSQNVAWIATAIAFLIAAQAARVWLKDRPRLFTAMALFALSWALLLVFYALIDPAKALPSALRTLSTLVDVLWIYIGGLLLLEARSAENPAPRVSRLQEGALGLLVLLIFPTSPLFGLFPPPIVIGTISLALDLIAAYALAFAIHKLTGKTEFFWVVATLVIYQIIELVSFGLDLKVDFARGRYAWELYAYSAVKIFFTIVFGYVIARLAMTETERRQSPLEHVGVFFGVVSRHREADAPA